MSGAQVMIPILVPTVFCAMVAWIALMVSRTSQSRITAQAEMRNKMIEKFGSSHEFVAFLQTPEGRSYLASLKDEPVSPLRKVLGSVRNGIVMVFISLGFIVASFLAVFERPLEEPEPPFIIGVIGLFLGVGFLVSATVSYKLSKQWGLVPPPDRLPTES